MTPLYISNLCSIDLFLSFYKFSKSSYGWNILGNYIENVYFIVAKASHVSSGVTYYAPFQMRNIFYLRATFEVISPLSFRDNVSISDRLSNLYVRIHFIRVFSN